jgi:hypothetical protein
MRMPFATKAQTRYRRWAGVMASRETESRKEEEEEEVMAKRMNEAVGGGKAGGGFFLTRSWGAGGRGGDGDVTNKDRLEEAEGRKW